MRVAALVNNSACDLLLSPLCFWSRVAAAPATCGVAMEVPDLTAKLIGPLKKVEVIDFPGAAISVQLPKFENDDIESSLSVLITVIILGPYLPLPPAPEGLL